MSSARISIENSFGRWKVQFGCLQRVMDVKVDTLPQVIYLCFVLHNYFKKKKENLPSQNLMPALNFEKSAQPSASCLSYGERVNENKAISIRNISLCTLNSMQCWYYRNKIKKVGSSPSEVFLWNSIPKNRQSP